jgi:hypothetical protein
LRRRELSFLEAVRVLQNGLQRFSGNLVKIDEMIDGRSHKSAFI